MVTAGARAIAYHWVDAIEPLPFAVQRNGDKWIADEGFGLPDAADGGVATKSRFVCSQFLVAYRRAETRARLPNINILQSHPCSNCRRIWP